MNDDWTAVTLGEVATYKPGRYLPKEQYVPDGEFWVYGSNSVMGKYGRALVDQPHVVMAAIGANAGAVRYSPRPSWINNNAFALIPGPDVDAFYLHLWLATLLDLGQVLAGTGQPYVQRPALMSQRIAVPPLRTQARVIDLIGVLDAQFEALRAERECAIALARTLPCASPDAGTRPLGTSVRARGGKRMPKGVPLSTSPTAHPYLRVVDMVGGTFSREDLLFVPEETWPSIQRYVVATDDLVISIVGTIGRVAIVPQWASGSNLTENAAIIDLLDASLDRAWLAAWLASEAGQREIERVTVGTSQGKLALARIPLIEVPTVELGEQVNRGRAATAARAYANAVAVEVRRLSGTRQTLLKKLMSGQFLIPDSYDSLMAV